MDASAGRRRQGLCLLAIPQNDAVLATANVPALWRSGEPRLGLSNRQIGRSNIVVTFVVAGVGRYQGKQALQFRVRRQPAQRTDMIRPMISRDDTVEGKLARSGCLGDR